MRTGFKYDNTTLLIISLISIIQSIISMTNSVLKADNAQMGLEKWKRYKKRFPPTKEFFQHGIGRLCEIIYRIGLLSLIWTVCEGLTFGIIVSIEFIFILAMSIGFQRYAKGVAPLSLEDIFLRLQTIIILPAELVYEIDDRRFSGFSNVFIHVCLCLCCCYDFSAIITTRCRCTRRRHYFILDIRIGVSLMEYIIIVLYAVYGIFFGENDNGERYLFDLNKGFIVFITSLICYFIYTQYLFLFPNFSLPFGASIRSKWGLSFNGELDDLKRIKLSPSSFPQNKKNRYGEKYTIDNEKEYWEETAGNPVEKDYRRSDISACPILYALANKQYHVVEWLEKEKDVSIHKELFNNQANDRVFLIEGCINTMWIPVAERIRIKFSNLDYLFARYCIDANADYFVPYWIPAKSIQ